VHTTETREGMVRGNRTLQKVRSTSDDTLHLGLALYGGKRALGRGKVRKDSLTGSRVSGDEEFRTGRLVFFKGERGDQLDGKGVKTSCSGNKREGNAFEREALKG